MKKTILLLALLLGTSTISAQSIQCTGIALSTGVQCEKKVALKHNRTKCHHHIDTDYTVQEDIDFNHVTTDTESSSNYPILEGLWVFLVILLVFTLPIAYMFGLAILSQYISDKTNIDGGWVLLLLILLPVIISMIFRD